MLSYTLLQAALACFGACLPPVAIALRSSNGLTLRCPSALRRSSIADASLLLSQRHPSLLRSSLGSLASSSMASASADGRRGDASVSSSRRASAAEDANPGTNFNSSAAFAGTAFGGSASGSSAPAPAADAAGSGWHHPAAALQQRRERPAGGAAGSRLVAVDGVLSRVGAGARPATTTAAASAGGGGAGRANLALPGGDKATAQGPPASPGSEAGSIRRLSVDELLRRPSQS